MDLFTPLVAEEDQHPNFRAMITPGFSDAERNILTAWSQGFLDRDGKFVREFQTTFNSSFWELYLHAAFRELGFSFDFSYNRPDFVLSGDSCQALAAEAVIAGHADRYRPEWERSLDLYEYFDRETVLHIATIRLANAIWSKHQKYKSSYAKLAHVQDKPFVICVAPFEQPLFFVQNDHALRRVLYAFDEPLWIDSIDGGRAWVGEAQMLEIVKDNGSEIPLGFFATDQMPEVSAVIFSNTATMTKVRALARDGQIPVMFLAVRYNAAGLQPHQISAPRSEYHETLLDGLHVCLNPFARIPLDVSPFEGREIVIHDVDPHSGQYLPRPPDGFLFQHGSIVLTFGTGAKTLAEIASETYQTPRIPSWNEGELYPVPGRVMSFTDHHLAHYEGWTVLVARDEIDDDWSAQALPGLFRSLAEYHRATKGDDFEVLGEWHATRDDAFRAMLKVIDEKAANPAAP